MNHQDGKNMIVPLEVEIGRLSQLLSEKEKRTNPRVMRKIGKFKLKLALLRQLLTPSRLNLAGVH